MKTKFRGFTIYSSDDTRAKWELNNYLEDGITIASRYFDSIKEAERFAKNEGWAEEDYSIVPIVRCDTKIDRDTIFDKLLELTNVADIDAVEEALKAYGELKDCDCGIDDGIDDDDCEDEYLMYKSFDLKTKGNKKFHIILYYGDNSFLFTDFNIN